MSVIDRLHENLWYRWHKRAVARAMTDPVYAEIEQKRRGDVAGFPTMFSAERGLGLDEWKTQTGIFRRMNPHPWWHRAYRAYVTGPREWPRRARRFVQRGRRGWADDDLFHLQWWLSQVIAGSVEALAEQFHSYPTDMTPETWKGVLEEIAAGLRGSSDATDDEHRKRQTRALVLLTESFDALSD